MIILILIHKNLNRKSSTLIKFSGVFDKISVLRKAINLGADSDTQAAIAGSIAEAFYGGVPDELWIPAKQKLDSELLEFIEYFHKIYILPKQQISTK